MKKSTRALALILAIALTSTAGIALAETNRARPQRPKNVFAKVLRCLQIVDLSEDQKTQIRGIFEFARPTMEGLAQELHADEATLKALLEADPPDACAIGAALLEVREDGEALRAETQNVIASVKLILSTEQQAKLAGCLEAPRDLAPAEGD